MSWIAKIMRRGLMAGLLNDVSSAFFVVYSVIGWDTILDFVQCLNYTAIHAEHRILFVLAGAVFEI